jgi:hypothetical protein
VLLIRTTVVILTKLSYNSDIKIRTGFLQLIIHQSNFQYTFLNLKTLLDCGRCALSQTLAGQLTCEFIIMSKYATVQICNNTSVIMTHSISHKPYAIALMAFQTQTAFRNLHILKRYFITHIVRILH